MSMAEGRESGFQCQQGMAAAEVVATTEMHSSSGSEPGLLQEQQMLLTTEPLACITDGPL